MNKRQRMLLVMPFFVGVLCAADSARRTEQKGYSVSIHALQTASPEPIRSLHFNSDGTLLVSGDVGNIHVHNVETGKTEQKFRTSGNLHDVALSPDSQELIACGWQGEARFQDLRMQKKQAINVQSPPGLSSFLPNCVRYSNDGKHLYIGDARGLVNMYDVRKRTSDQCLDLASKVCELKGGNVPGYVCAMSAIAEDSSGNIFVRTSDGCLAVYNVRERTGSIDLESKVTDVFAVNDDGLLRVGEELIESSGAEYVSVFHDGKSEIRAFDTHQTYVRDYHQGKDRKKRIRVKVAPRNYRSKSLKRNSSKRRVPQPPSAKLYPFDKVAVTEDIVVAGEVEYLDKCPEIFQQHKYIEFWNTATGEQIYRGRSPVAYDRIKLVAAWQACAAIGTRNGNVYLYRVGCDDAIADK